MKRILITFFLFSISILSFAQNEKNSIAEKIGRIENGLIEFKSINGMFFPDSAQLANRVRLEERMALYKVPGISISVINNFQIEWSRAYGIADKKTGTQVTTETLFEAASTSKLLTAVMSLYLVEKGLLNLDEDVNTYLKSWKVPENEFTKDEKVTLRRLLTHLAGLPMTNFDYDEKAGYPTLLDVLNGKSPALNKPAIPEAVPGSRWMYSNVGYDLIQLLIEDATGKPFAQFAGEIIFEPLDMRNSTFSYPLNGEMKQREAMPHNEEGESCEPSMHLTAFGHAGLVTTPSDLAKFTLELLLAYTGKSDKIISSKTVHSLFENQVNLDPNIFGAPLSMGLGCIIQGEGNNLLFAHPGNNYPGMISWLIGWPQKGIGFIIMSNGAMGEPLSIEIITALIKEYLN